MGKFLFSVILAVFALYGLALTCITVTSGVVSGIFHSQNKRIDRTLPMTVRKHISEEDAAMLYTPARTAGWEFIYLPPEEHSPETRKIIEPYANAGAGGVYDPFSWVDLNSDEIYMDEYGSYYNMPAPGRVPGQLNKWRAETLAMRQAGYPPEVVQNAGGIFSRVPFHDKIVRLTDNFGGRKSNRPTHFAVDLSMYEGTPLKSIHMGPAVVTFVGYMPYGYGYYVVLDDGVNAVLYAHLQPQGLPSVGAVIQPGQVFALSGNTGQSTGPHLHLELWRYTGGKWYVHDPCESIATTCRLLGETVN